MKTILIPVDFSNTCLNTLKFVADLSMTTRIERIVLLKSYYVSIYAQLLPSADFVQVDADTIQQERQQQEDQLKTVSQELLQSCGCDIQVKIASSEEPLLRAIHYCIATEKPDVIILGSDGAYSTEESYVGQQVVTVAKTSPVPVLIVPPHAKYQPLKQAVVPCDFTAVSRLNILKELRSLQLSSNPELLVLNVDPQQKRISHDEEYVEALKEALESYQYKVYYADDKDTVKGIINFADKNDVQLIIALPGKHSFFYNLTHQSITEALAVNSHQPILILK